MRFPPFSDFLSTLTEERMVEIFGDYQTMDIVQMNGITQENISALLSNLVSQNASHAIALHLRLLAAYHEWLSQSLSHLI